MLDEAGLRAMMADLQSDRVERTTSITDKTRNDYRNPTVAEAMKVLGFVNKYGRGVLRAQAELRATATPRRSITSTPASCR